MIPLKPLQLHPRRRRPLAVSIALLAGCLLWLAPAPASAQTPPAAPPAAAEPLPDVAQQISRLVQSMDRAEKSVGDMKDRDEDLGRLRGETEGILSDSTNTAEELRPQLAAVKSQIDRLGPAPAKDAPAEAATVAAERARLLTLAAALEGAIKTTELTWVRARQLIERITELRHQIFTRDLMHQLPSPLLPAIWRDALRAVPTVQQHLAYIAADWWGWAAPKSLGLFALLLTAGLLFGLLHYSFRRFVLGRMRGERACPPSFFERAAAIAWTAPARAIAPIFAALCVYGGLDALDLLYFPGDRVAAAVLKGVLIYAAVAAIIAGVLSPGEPQWRLVPLADDSARRIGRLLNGMTAVYAADLALSDTHRWLFVPLSIGVVQALVASLGIAGLLIALLATPFRKARQSQPQPVSRVQPWWLKAPLLLVVVAIIGACLLGYVALGRFVAQQFVLTGVVMVSAGLLYLAVRAFTREPVDAAYPVGELLQTRFGLDAPRRHQLARLTEFALTVVLLTLAFPIVLLQWGFSGDDIRDWLKQAFFGFEVGQFRISIARILLGIFLFTALLFLTRLLQRWLRDAVLQPPRVDTGVAHSIDTTVGYAGIAVAALMAVSFAGLDITNLAIVAGALSVGIGFGLQSIVNNFVSGLILLIERPIKVGDWIVVKGQEGYVRRISVRATEIETFDRASLIVPNSELITGTVTNWTHRNALGRIVIKVGVSYAADPEQVRDLLAAVAAANPSVLKQPPPRVQLDDLGTNALEFSVRVLVADINAGGDVKNDLRFAILKALRAAEIEIPYAQHDVHLRDLDGVRRGLAAALEARRREVRVDGEG